MSKALHPNQLRPGDRVREYRLLRRVGTGGFSLVFLAEHEGSLYAMKIALQPASDATEDHVDGWMRREAASLEHLAHPNLLPVHEMGRWPHPRTGYSFFVTDHIPGDTFHEWRQRVRATPYQWVGVLCEVLCALEALHEHGVCHRDIKADNVLVREGDDRPFLIDFGAVHLPCARPLTEGLAPGTIYCQPPEAIRFLMGKEVLEKGARFEAHPSADLYAVGILLYEALTGCHPFDPKLPLDQLLLAIVTLSPTEPRQHDPEAPSSLAALAMRLLAKDPGRRPPSARAVREELERLRAEEGDTASWRKPSVSLAERVKVGESPERGVREPSRVGHRRKALLALVLGFGLLGLVMWGLLRAEGIPWLNEASHPVEPTAPVPPVPSEQGPQPVQPTQQPTRDPSSPDTSEVPSRTCTVLRAVLGAAIAQLVGCVTTPAVRPDPVGYLDRCPPEARATPKKLGLEAPYVYNADLLGVTLASAEPIEKGGSVNIKPGPIKARMFANYEPEKTLILAGEVVATTRMRVYVQFDRIQLPDGSWLPICGAAASVWEEVYGIPTREGVVYPNSIVDPAKVDHSPGSVVLNDVHLLAVFEPPPGEPRANIGLVDPEARPKINVGQSDEK
ncbi:serine/threonine-protein kinase [Vitiosangium sp. GDMCC 1.1324]|uniref:serine/threonine protein kinase n=1 Tax=Vitiosangium sp. (strain GDMCC 1.1324) TaxID=2138576 RepID=UPI000D3DC240|nr:serine/threonine-protein kinase [Vitiosangium sp. GDMCC 1.1324]PTL83619.1 hypothetical protein DAT35_09020 [Vitiosangium sp. GDMCC 1.1324]